MSRKVVCCLAFLGIAACVAWHCRPVRFDSLAWKNANDEPDNPARRRMLGDLLRRHQLVGMSRDQVDELLGPPFLRMAGSGGMDYFYRLGPKQRAFSNDAECEWLTIKFKQQVVTKTEVAKSSALPPNPLFHVVDGG